MERRKPAQEPEQTEQRRTIIPLRRRQTVIPPTFANATALDIINTGMSTADTSSAEALTRSAQNAQTRADASLVESQQYNAALAREGAAARETPAREAPVGAPAPRREPQPNKHGRKLLIGGGIAALVTAAGAVFGMKTTGTGIFSSDSGNDSGVNLTVPTPDNTPAGIGIVVKETPTAEHTVTATPSPEKVDLNIFKPNAIREVHGNTILTVDENYTPQVNKLSLNPDLPKEEAEERLAEFTNQIKFVAWEKLSQGKTDAQLLANYDNLYSEYKARTANEVLEFPITAFTDKSNYRVAEPTTAKSSDKIEIEFLANKGDQEPIAISTSLYTGLLRNEKTATITIAIFDTTHGGIDQKNIQYPRDSYGASSSAILGGIVLGDKTLQEKKNAVTETDRITPLITKLQGSLIHKIDATNWEGAITTQR